MRHRGRRRRRRRRRQSLAVLHSGCERLDAMNFEELSMQKKIQVKISSQQPAIRYGPYYRRLSPNSPSQGSAAL